MHHAALRSLIQDCCASTHGAIPASDYPSYLTVGVPDDPLAALELRHAGKGALFLEKDLACPIERALTARTGRPVPRSRIVEFGDHTSRRPRATICLWREAAAALDGHADFAVAVLTAPLRKTFARLRLPMIELAPACAEAMGADAARWGRYYDTDPIVCAGDIAACRRLLDRTVRP